MTLYAIKNDALERVSETTFESEGVLERRDLQKMIRDNIEILGDDLCIIAEEFSDWQNSTRSIDLLCLTRSGDLAVIELKRTQDAGHAELQAIRYAAMVSSMTMADAISAYAKFSGSTAEAAKTALYDFLRLDPSCEVSLSGNVKILLASADFSAEIATTVLWLNKSGLDITCFRLTPYKLDERLLIDAEQIIPIPEAREYTIKLRKKASEDRRAEEAQQNARSEIYSSFWSQLIALSETRALGLYPADRSTRKSYLSSREPRGFRGVGISADLGPSTCAVTCYIEIGANNAQENKRKFDMLFARRQDIEPHVQGDIKWDRMDDRKAAKFQVVYPAGYDSPRENWHDIQAWMIDRTVELNNAIRPILEEIQTSITK